MYMYLLVWGHACYFLLIYINVQHYFYFINLKLTILVTVL